MAESDRERLKAELEQKLGPRLLVAFEGKGLDTLISLKCFNLDMLSRLSPGDLKSAGLPAMLIGILEETNLIGEEHSLGAAAVWPALRPVPLPE